MKNYIAIRLLAVMMLYSVFSTAFAQVGVDNLLTENLKNPIGLDILKPRFTWQLVSDKRNVLQTAYEIQVAASSENLKNKKDLKWSTGKVRSDQSVLVEYQGEALKADQQYFWQVRVWDNEGKVSSWSKPAFWHTALFSPADWKAKWITVGYDEDTLLRPSPLMRKTFSTSKKIQHATAFITAQGLYEAFLNGKRIGDSYLTPGWTSYNNRIQYQQYDVTSLLRQGNNAIGVMLGSGWYRGYIGFSGQKNFYGKDLSLLMQVNILYADGSSEVIVSDESWKCSTGSIVSSEIYDGEIIDARKEKTGWLTASYGDAQWTAVKVKENYAGKLIGTYNEPIRKQERFKALKLITTPKGEQVLDFGQNLVGWVEVKVTGNKGDSLILHHTEVLDKFGNFYTENLRAAKQRNVYILNGVEEEFFEPHFTFQGFRYVKVTGVKGKLNPDNFTAVALYSDMKPTGNFRCSNPLITQLQHNIQWGQKGNFLDVPTDCPQRDERLGWTGDAQVFSRTATFNMDVNNFFAKWLRDLEADQIGGSVPYVVPNVLSSTASGSAGWGDAATIIPWNLYLAYGDKRHLEVQYESMKAWVEFISRKSNINLWNTGFHFGDWLFYAPDDDRDGTAAITDKYLITQCFYAHSTTLLIKAAKILGKSDDVAKYEEKLKVIKDAFVKEFLTANGRLVSSTQTAYTLALNFDMLPEQLRAQAAKRLVENINNYGNHLTTGFLGTPYLCHVLTRFGYTDVAYTLLLQEKYPSWLYPVKMGATTIWERWDGIKPDSTFQTPRMNSFNHYAYGAIGDWIYRIVTGIDTEESAPGYKAIRIKPHLDKRLTSASAEYMTYYGKIESSWDNAGDELRFTVRIPPNTSASIFVPASSADDIRENGKKVSDVKGLTVKASENGYVVIATGSGLYNFTVSK